MVSLKSIQILLAVLIPSASAIGYIHGAFVTKMEFQEKIIKLDSTDAKILKISCRMAIRLKVHNVEDICILD